LLFNRFTAVSERRGWIDGYTSFYVAFGVAMTILIAQPLLGWEVVVILVKVFVVAGAPMMIGHTARHIRARRAEQAEIVAELRGE
jgi:hypothetical protein